MNLMAKIIVALLVTHMFSYWVVKGYQYPPQIVAGPYANRTDCDYAAREINRVQMSYEYRCEWH